MREIAALFVRADSVYKTLPGVDAWDRARDARRWPGGTPIVAHPPCAQWSRLRRFARRDDAERELAPWAVRQVQQWGGVLEHPASSELWAYCKLPKPGARDAHGWTMGVHQHWLGHRAAKATLLYIVGTDPRDVPQLELRLDEPTHVVQGRGGRPHITKAEREHTPEPFARWLVAVARASAAA